MIPLHVPFNRGIEWHEKILFMHDASIKNLKSKELMY
jgi:hypothetical protein